MEKVDLPEMENGKWKIEKFTIEQIDLYSLFHGRAIYSGTYTRLMRNGRIVMSDTNAEMRDHSIALYRAEGSCLINGLGIGMLLKNILLKDSVTDITVVEISKELIDMVGPYYNDDRVTIIHANAYEYKPPKGKRYQMVWHDIWDDICSDNLPEMTKLHRKYGKRADWQGSWGKELCKRQRQECF